MSDAVSDVLQPLRQAGGVFVTGTDTDVGKTVVAAALVRALDADYWKPVQAGLDSGGDPQEVARLAELPADRIHPCTYTLTRPRSPHEAARADGLRIELSEFLTPHTKRPLVIEGAGGLLVPLNDQEFVADLAEQLDFPIVLVTRASLGTINHTLLTVESMRARGLPLAGIVMNGPIDSENRASLDAFANAPWIVEFPHRENLGPAVCRSFAEQLAAAVPASEPASEPASASASASAPASASASASANNLRTAGGDRT